MSEILFFIFIVLLTVFLFGVLRSITKRVFLIMKLRELRKMTGAKIKYHALPFLSLIKFSDKPEISVEMTDRVYLIRLIGAKSKTRRVHFANPEFTVTTRGRRTSGGVKILAMGRAGLRRGRFVRVQPQYYSPKVGKVRFLPKLKIADEGVLNKKKAVPVLIFNPAPHDVTYVTPEKNKVLAAFTGDTVYDHLIFTASTFVTYAERHERQEAERRKSSSYWDEYFS